MSDTYNIALFQQSLHLSIHPPTNKSLKPNKRRWRTAVKGGEKRVGTPVAPSFVIAPTLRPLLLGLMIDVVVDEPILVISVMFHYFFRLHSVLLEVRLRTGCDWLRGVRAESVRREQDRTV